MKICLTKNGPAMWFLGSPEKLIVSLNYINPGPVKINFDKLDEVSKQKLVKDISLGWIESDEDIDLSQLEDIGSKELRMMTPQEERALELEQRLIKQRKLEAKREKRLKHWSNVLSRNYISAKKAVAKVQKIDILKLIAEIEMQKKQRNSILKMIQKKIAIIQLAEHRKRERKIKKEIRKQQMIALRKDKLPIEVISSKSVVVTMTPEDIIKASIKHNQG